ncbi:MAG: lipid A biosynthesis protein [Rickettsiales bacterium]|nr:lipid A biosynthesis protein [Rickettsiales bacterium]OUV81293.1 MAG: lipid A biosynthesis protein [Rickettsiales bacterium TMED131]
MEISLGWLIIGFAGQIFFSARFILQWIYSEINKKSIIPLGFWFFSILGGITLLVYAIHRKDPVFIMGQATGLLIYGRNLYFINKQNKINLNVKTILKNIKIFLKDVLSLIRDNK